LAEASLALILVMFPLLMVALKLSNFILPLSILRFGNPEVVSNPLSVGLNGGEVSVGGQHNERSPSANRVLVTVKFPPDAIAAVVAGLIVIVEPVKLETVVLEAN
jgi:hypothetical protein